MSKICNSYVVVLKIFHKNRIITTIESYQRGLPIFLCTSIYFLYINYISFLNNLVETDLLDFIHPDSLRRLDNFLRIGFDI